MISDWGITQGARLKELRLKKGFTVPYVAKKIDCGEASIYRWELGQVCPRHKFLRDMAFLYNVPMEEITGGDSSGITVNPMPYIESDKFPAAVIAAPHLDETDIVSVNKKTGELLEMMARLTRNTKQNVLENAVREYALYIFKWDSAVEGFCNG